MTNTDATGDWNSTGATNGAEASPKTLAKKTAQTVKQEAQTFAADARQKAVEQAEQHKQTATRTLGDFADAIRRAGDELSQKDQSMASRLVQQAADGLENLSRSVSDKRPEELLDAVRDFGRRNPTAFVAGSVLVGLAIGRFLSSSASHPVSMDARFTAPGGAPATFEPEVQSFMGEDTGAIGGSSADLSGMEGADISGAAVTSDVVSTGATSIGAPETELGGMTDIEVDDTIDGAEDGDDRDTARFRNPGV